MLIITRRVDEGFRIYDADGRCLGHVMVLGIKRDRVRLGIDCGPRFLVLRDELVADARPELLQDGAQAVGT